MIHTVIVNRQGSVPWRKRPADPILAAPPGSSDKLEGSSWVYAARLGRPGRNPESGINPLGAVGLRRCSRRCLRLQQADERRRSVRAEGPGLNLGKSKRFEHRARAGRAEASQVMAARYVPLHGPG